MKRNKGIRHTSVVSFRSAPRGLPLSVRQLKSYWNVILRQKPFSGVSFYWRGFLLCRYMCFYISNSFSRFSSSLPVFPMICNHRSVLTFSYRTNDCPYFRNAIGHTGHIYFLGKQLTENLVTFLVLNWGVKLVPQPHSFWYADVNVLPNNVKCQMC